MVFAGRTFRRRLPAPPGFTDEQLRAVSVPVQVLLGERSALHDAQQVAARLATVLPRWRVEIVPGTGHALAIEAPQLVVERILGFADQAQPGVAEPEPTENRPER
jgi:pimeloyl-ACP methyl ester carboxylesterase